MSDNFNFQQGSNISNQQNVSNKNKDDGIVRNIIKRLLVLLVFAGLVYLLYKLTGVNLTDFGL